MNDDVWKLDATAQAALVRAAEVSPRELVELAIRRIEALNPRINAVITPLFERALAQAETVAHDAPFAGVPMLLKDASIEVEGTPYYIGTRALRDAGYRSPRTTELARRFERAGFIFVGKTNVPELSADSTTEPTAFGPTRNPWDLDRTAGGSSGGSAAAVAAGMTAIAHGADGTGSLRYPAACCGVATLKPSRARVPGESAAGQPDPGDVWSEFVLTRSVRDLAGVLDAVAGPRPGTPSVVPAPARPYADELRPPNRPLRVALMTRDVTGGVAIHPDCVESVERTGAVLREHGHAVEDAHPPALERMATIGRSRLPILTVYRDAQYRWLERAAGRPVTQDELDHQLVTPEMASRVPAVTYIHAQRELDALGRDLRAWFGDGGFDLLVTPVISEPAWPLGRGGATLRAGASRSAEERHYFAAAFSFSGQPAMSLPLHTTPAGLPVGVQLVAGFAREDLLFQIASQLERAVPWAARWPPLAIEA